MLGNEREVEKNEKLEKNRERKKSQVENEAWKGVDGRNERRRGKKEITYHEEHC